MYRSNDRRLLAGSLGTGAVVSLLSLLSLVLEWSWGVQLMLTLVMGVALIGMQIGTKRVHRRR